jgi:uncharacterized protein YdaU (DUF1376 family)
MAEFPSLPLWTDAYLGDTMHLDATEHGAYLLLLISAWRTDDTALPDDDRKLARYARCTPKVWQKIRPTIADFFTISDGKWVQQRLFEEKSIVTQRRDKAAQNGRASALKRKERHSTKRPTKRERSDEQTASRAINGMPTPIPIPIPIEEEIVESSSPRLPAKIHDDGAEYGPIGSLAAKFVKAGGVAANPQRKNWPNQLDVVREWQALGLDPDTEIIPALEQEVLDNPIERHSLKIFNPLIHGIAARKEARSNGRQHRNGRNPSNRSSNGFLNALNEIADRKAADPDADDNGRMPRAS